MGMSYDRSEASLSLQKARELLAVIRTLPGKKIVTLSILLDDETSDFVFDINEDGKVGYHKDHGKQLMTLLDYGIQNSGGLIIRQFTRMTYEGHATDGRPMRYPYKLIYAVFLGNSDYFALSKEETEDVCCTDARTGHRMKKEDGVIYRGLRLTQHRAAAH
jgi:hypothetical protein